MVNEQLLDRIIPVDLGFGYTKAKRGAKTFRQPSVVGVQRRVHEQDVREEDIVLGIEQDNFQAQYFVGNVAIRKALVRYYSTYDDKANTWTTNLLLASALAHLSKDQEDIMLVTGLPFDFYFKQRGEMYQFIKKFNSDGPRYQFKFGKDDPIISKPNIVHSIVTIQPMGAAMNYLLNEKGQFNDRDEASNIIIVGDIGFHTFDLLVLDNMEIHRFSHSNTDISISNVYTVIQDWLREQIGSSPDLYELDYYILRGNYNGIDLLPKFEESMANIARQAKLALESLNLPYHRYISTGGWATIVTPLMDLPKVTTVIYDQEGNINGYEKIGTRACLKG